MKLFSKYNPEGLGVSKCGLGRISMRTLDSALKTGSILEARVKKCDENYNLIIDLAPNVEGILYKDDIEWSRSNSKLKNVAILSKVGKHIKFKVTDITELDNGKTVVTCSRALAQMECYSSYISNLTPGDVIPARVTHIEDYGIFCDIGCGIVGLLPISNYSIVRIPDAKHSLRALRDITVVVDSIAEDGKVTLSHRELLGTWEEQISEFNVGDIVPGVVRCIEDFGIFIEISQNLSGLAESNPEISLGDRVNVYIKDIKPSNIRVKLDIVSYEDCSHERALAPRIDYVIKTGHIDSWVYTPDNCEKVIESVFDKK